MNIIKGISANNNESSFSSDTCRNFLVNDYFENVATSLDKIVMAFLKCVLHCDTHLSSNSGSLRITLSTNYYSQGNFT